jgi:hypothetical protein
LQNQKKHPRLGLAGHQKKQMQRQNKQPIEKSKAGFFDESQQQQN